MGRDPTDDRLLVERTRGGDREAFRLLVERYQRRVFALLYGILRDAHEVEDVAQEVFLKVYTRIHAFDGQSRFYTWLYRVAVNQAKDHLKKLRRRPAVALDESEPPPDTAAGPPQRAQVAELRRRVRSAIAGLPERYRTVLALREPEGLAYREIAGVLEVSLGTVESRLHRARAMLKRRLESHVQ
ncbi:MAG: sigma-70 family RNA polymerase sigma factor [Planctomycetota bacterium]